MKKLFFALIATVLLSNFSFSQVSAEKEKSNAYFKANIAITDFLYSLAETGYVKQIVLTDFSQKYNKANFSNELIFNGTTFLDNGEGYDKIAGDGVFTTSEIFKDDALVKKITSNKGTLSIMLEKYIADKSFKFKEIASNTTLAKVHPSAGIDCDITFGTCGCRADSWGWCNCCCFSLSNCHVSIGIG